MPESRNKQAATPAKKSRPSETDNDTLADVALGRNSDRIFGRMRLAFARLNKLGFALEPDTDFNFAQAAQRFTTATLHKVFALGQLIAEQQPGGLTVRGALYRAVSTGIYAGTGKNDYRACGRLILLMRRYSLIPYDWIRDSTRRKLKPSSWKNLVEFAETAANAYRKDLWQNQETYVEVLTEKDAMAAILELVTEEFDIGLNVLRGDSSETFLWELAQEWSTIEKPIQVYYLGDHDPKGLAIEKDASKRLTEFLDGREIGWLRLAVTRTDFANQVLLGFPTKKNPRDPLWPPYIAQYGDRCVEVDAIPANEIRARLSTAIQSHIDWANWNPLKVIETAERARARQALEDLA
jgi:hypothetical protein